MPYFFPPTFTVYGIHQKCLKYQEKKHYKHHVWMSLIELKISKSVFMQSCYKTSSQIPTHMRFLFFFFCSFQFYYDLTFPEDIQFSERLDTVAIYGLIWGFECYHTCKHAHTHTNKEKLWHEATLPPSSPKIQKQCLFSWHICWEK